MRIVCGLTSLLLIGCGGSGSTNMDMGSDMKPAPPVYVEPTPDAGMPADYSCLGSRMDPAAPTMDTMVSGVIKDFQDNDIVVGAVVKVYVSAADVPNNPAATSMPTDMNGAYTITVPKGHYRMIWSNSGGMAISNGNPVATIPTYEFNQVYNYKSPVSVKESTRDAISGLVSIIQDPMLGVFAGSVRDCNNKEVGGATVQITMTASPYDSDKNTFYFNSANKLPVRTLHWTADNGVFASLNVPAPGTGTMTAYGIVGSGAPQKLGTNTIPVQPGAITIADILPLGP